ncbi:DUF2799 domain-containing protein [bacterium]|nr:MAG: DUF2799 domain-containing protein [bacterium]
MNARRYIFSLLPILGLLASCATMNRDECLTVDWQTVGYEDGVAGRPADRIAQHRKACAKHGVTPDLRAYQAGRDEGLREYCQPQNGYRLGERGGDYGGFCPADLAPAFEASWRDGLELFGLRSRVNDAANDVRNMAAEMDRNEDAIIAASAFVIDSNADRSQKAQALLDVQRLTERQSVLRVEIRQRQNDQLNFQRDLDHYLSNAAPR